ncbi:hypothetical protein [Methylotuvimicrobium alcaliphilum]|jgi:hypothetical protein|uniref:Secreted protein n=1 Tax=Methylotuvimicrobium alcaliphilum (strain DSM 19304 / NCIMB 14124 / VKM B-2133 / 20Z) TaxID=1091494 RepID=G4T279_META2|nr:hypothetical protein [Methylotuvimicrobium alcaliphilum]CCE22505.1 conserved exported protein of unknown function [Methylotuvimicrobium alcaliphilum 20Z]
MTNITIKKTLFAGLSLALCGLGSNAYAHTGIQNQINGTGTTYNNIVIGHTCALNGRPLPVTAQSVVFPTVTPYFTVDNAPVDISLEDITNRSTLAGWPQLIQDNNIFRRQSEKTDAQGNVIGFEGFRGRLDHNLHGLVPFRTGGISFKEDTTGIVGPACIQRLQIKIAIADICRNRFPPVEGTANTWIPNTTSKFTTEMNGATSGLRSGAPATLTINNPNCAEGETVVMWPSDQDVDANLPIQRRWGR